MKVKPQLSSMSLSLIHICFEALKKGEIDMYVDYTGTIYVNILNQPAKADMQAVYDAVSYTHLDCLADCSAADVRRVSG